MLYSNFNNLKLSRLGFGVMRLPTTGDNKVIDAEKAMDMVVYAHEHGVNYFDTAYFYHSGESERFIGKALARFPRDSFYLADKMPGNAMTIVDGKIKLDLFFSNNKDVLYNDPAEVFQEQLIRCGVDYFDFYLLHNLSESTYDIYTDEKLGIIDYLLSQKKAGRIRHLGLSSHGLPGTIDKFLSTYDCFEFVQIQLNYLDWSLQEAGKKYDIITKHGLPVIVMEPMRGGTLANPGEKGTAILKAERPDESPASFAFRFVKALPNVAVVLSGMSAMEQLKENLEIFNKDEPFTETDNTSVIHVVKALADFVPCTSCRYCCEKCPQGLDIPTLLTTYNEASIAVTWYVNSILEELADGKKPQDCTGCGTCSQVCPQNIDIPGVIKSLLEILEKK